MENLTVLQMATKLGLNLSERRLGYNLTNNPNELMANGVKFITIHQTGNTDFGADAERHHAFQKNNSGGAEASWHYTVDETGAIQSFRDERVLWHSANKIGNNSSIGIEMCIDADKRGESIMGKDNYLTTLHNTEKLVAVLLTSHGLTVNELRQHNDWSGKDCPAQLRKGLYGYTWANFLSGVTAQVTALQKALQPVPTQTLAPEGKLFRVVLDAFAIRENAVALIDEAKEKGFSPYLVLTDDPNYKK